MQFYRCHVIFHENLYYETRTLGRLYETGRLLHNIALCYALGFAQTSYHHADHIPHYAEEIEGINEKGIYITPATGIDVRYAIHTFKLGGERTYAYMEKSNENIPSFGRAKEVAIGSKFQFGVFSENELVFPKWIRMGIWMSKARLLVDPPVPLTQKGRSTATVSDFPINPSDLPRSARLEMFDLVSMRPTSLVENAEITADTWWEWEPDGDRKPGIRLPAGMRHNVVVPAR